MRSDSGVTCGGPACRYNAIVNTGIKIVERVPIPKELVTKKSRGVEAKSRKVGTAAQSKL